MEIGKIYSFLNEDGKYEVGDYIATNGKDRFAFFSNNKIKFGNPHDEINPFNNSNNFIEYVAKKFQNKFERNASVWHEDYEFKISIPHEDNRILDDVEELMNDILEDWWSVQWQELRHNSIHVNRNDVIITFRAHDVHETEFRYNDMELNNA